MAAKEFNRGCYSILAGLLGGAVGAVAFIVLAFVISITACVVLVVILNAVIQKIDEIPTPRYDDPKSQLWEDKMTLQTTSETGIIGTNVPGGKLTMSQQVDLSSLQFVPDPELIGKTIRIYDASKKYGVPHNTIHHWTKSGIVTVIESGPKLMILDESTLARAVAIFKYACQHTTPRKAAWILKKAIATA